MGLGVLGLASLPVPAPHQFGFWVQLMVLVALQSKECIVSRQERFAAPRRTAEVVGDRSLGRPE